MFGIGPSGLLLGALITRPGLKTKLTSIMALVLILLDTNKKEIKSSVRHPPKEQDSAWNLTKVDLPVVRSAPSSHHELTKQLEVPPDHHVGSNICLRLDTAHSSF